jgi:4'-phosphopantetheinyl transferase
MIPEFSLADRQVHIWLVDPTSITNPALLDRYHALLTPEEHAKWQRYRFDKDKHQHLVTRALIRDTLSRYEPHVAPQDWRFELNQHGKPAITNPLSIPLFFNLSHTQNLAALAVTRTSSVGVDVEKVKQVEQVRGLAERCFADREIDYVFNGEKAALMWRFFKLWTLKEAYIKARGCGLSLSLQSVVFAPLAQPLMVDFAPSHDDCPANWSFRNWEVGSGHLLSLAVNVDSARSPMVHLFNVTPLGTFAPASAREVTGR